MNEVDILGFDPQSLKIFNETESNKSQGNPLIYKTRPADSVSEDGVYRATIKVVYNPHDLRNSVLEQQTYAMEDADGWFTAISKLTNNDTDCPIFKAWKKCRYAKDGDPLKQLSKPISEGGKFDKRFARYVTVQILEDKNQPELVNKFLFWKLPKSIWDIINAKMNPSVESKKAPIPVMDFLFGRSIDIEVVPGPDDKAHPERKARETKYMGELSEDIVSCVDPNGKSLLTADEQDILDQYIFAMNKVWKCKEPEERARMKAIIDANDNTKKLMTIYGKVLNNLKTFCPNLTEELGYKEWDEKLANRVNNWINAILSGQDPKGARADIVVNDETKSETEDFFGKLDAAAKTVEEPTTKEDETDELPF